MVKRLIAVLIALTMVACTAAPVYADMSVIQGVTISLADDETAKIGENGVTQQPTAEANAQTAEDKNYAAQEGSESENGSDAQEPANTDGENGASQEPAAKDEEGTANEDGKDDTEDKDEKKTSTSKTKTKKVSKYQKGLAAYIRSKNKNLSKDWSITLAGYFLTIGDKYDVPPTILMALARRESNFCKNATSVYGYKGMMQLGDAFAKRYGYKVSDLYKASVSIEIAARYLKAMKKRHGTYTKALSCYICGSGAVASGNYSKKPAWAVMNIRAGIKDYLKEHGYTS